MLPLKTDADIAAAATSLAALVPAFGPVISKAGTIPLRYRPPGYEGLASIIIAQVVSRASADAIWRKLDVITGGITVDNILARSVDELMAAGLSRAKQSTLRGLAQACRDGLDLEHIASLDADVAISELTAVRGIGLWTSEVFLLFCAGHPDVFPTGDVALQAAAVHAFGLAERPKPKEFRAMALDWQPYRSIAARILWAYYASEMKRDGIPVA